MIEIYTDGASRGNPGPGGYGVIMHYKGKVKKFSQGYRLTTNNRMELMAVIKALEAIKGTGWDITIYTDSKYVADAVNKGWIFKWEKSGFRGKKNVDLWKRFLQLYRKHHIKLVWIRGHNDHPLNEECDRMAVQAAKGNNLAVDTGYETTLNR